MKCPNCNGEGGWDIGVPCGPDEVMWVSDGDLMTLGFKECYFCAGTGEISKEKLAEYKKLKGKKK